MNLLAVLAALAVFVIPSIYIYAVNMVQMRYPTLRGKRICLLIAHPDDEAMFFAPTVLALTRPELDNHVKILCLSTGNADGLGETRKRELVKSGMMLGLKGEDDVFVMDSPDFLDSMTETWDEDKISDVLLRAFGPDPNDHSADDKGPPKAEINVLVTFDGHGVSSHPNHISLYHGARAFIAALSHGTTGWSSPVDLYTLRTVNMLRKYSSIVDIFATLTSRMFVRHENNGHPSALVFANKLTGEGGLSTARRAMIEAHRSQMVWFRHGWITFSRYMVINDLRLENVRGS